MSSVGQFWGAYHDDRVLAAHFGAGCTWTTFTWPELMWLGDIPFWSTAIWHASVTCVISMLMVYIDELNRSFHLAIKWNVWWDYLQLAPQFSITSNNNNDDINNNYNNNNNNLYCGLPPVMVHNKWTAYKMINGKKYSGPSFRVPGRAIVIVCGRLDVFNINTSLIVSGDYVISSQSWLGSQHPPFNIHLAHKEDEWGPSHLTHLYM